MRIGELAESTGTAVETIRFYEREGLIPAAQRADNNYRVYTAAHAVRSRSRAEASRNRTPSAFFALASACACNLPALRWRNLDRSSMGVALWEALLANPATPASLIDELYAIELQRIVLNMQISLTHSIARQALECANKAAQAEAAYLRRVHGHTASVPPTTKESP